MLTRILDTSEIDINDSEIQAELNTDLRRMDRLKHENIPGGSDAYKVKVMPSNRTYYHGLHRFIFEIQYGNLINGKVKPKGKKVFCQTETLPMI